MKRSPKRLTSPIPEAFLVSAWDSVSFLELKFSFIASSESSLRSFPPDGEDWCGSANGGTVPPVAERTRIRTRRVVGVVAVIWGVRNCGSCANEMTTFANNTHALYKCEVPPVPPAPQTSTPTRCECGNVECQPILNNGDPKQQLHMAPERII